MNEADQGSRVVLPQWLPFRAAAAQRESSAVVDLVPSTSFLATREAFQEALAEFRIRPNEYIAVELLGIAELLGERTIARDIAAYIIEQPILSRVAQEQARSHLGRSARTQLTEPAHQLRSTKQRVRVFPLDAIAWLEQARLYTILGQYEKGRRSILAAVQLAPGNRLIARCAMRFFAHFGQWSDAVAVGQRAYAMNRDPMIFGPLLSVSSRAGKLPNMVKSHVKEALNASTPFIYSEALEAFGTLELMAGADNRSKQYFRRAWVDPAKPVVGHSQWILREHLPSLASEQSIDFWSSKEAVSCLRFAMLDFRSAAQDATDWALEEPFSRSPHIIGSMASCIAGDFPAAAVTARRGLVANPKDEILINNLAFALLRERKVREAEEVFHPLVPRLEDKNQIATKATYGLLHFAKGDIEEGTRHYAEAIARALDKGDRRNALRATLNLIITSIDYAKIIDPALLGAARSALGEIQDPACIGIAHVLSEKLRAADLSGSDQLSVAAKGFADSAAKARLAFEETITAKLLEAAPKHPQDPGGVIGNAGKEGPPLE